MAGIGTSEPPKLAEYDVFLSFRGSDTRKNFTSCLYHDLTGAGIRVFRDDDELSKGKEIGSELPRAIANSRVFMPILSPNFATSAWCLREVAHAVECRQKSSGATLVIMPIFYNVDVADVKLREGSTYELHVDQHKNRFEKEVLQKWKEALKGVAKIKGWSLNDETDHGELIKSIVQELLAKLNINYRNLPKMLVGIYQAEDIMQLINADAEGVRFIVIHGMGGIGKTTLAQVVFNWLNARYDGCSFLDDVRESSNLHGILHLQKKLLSDIINPKFGGGIRDSNDGINQIRTRLCDKKVLIVLDDVDNEKQLKNLAGSSDWFGFGSRIIITTRDRGVLLMQGEKDKYFHYGVEQMEFNDALRLFSWHSFGKDYPPNDYADLSREIVSITASLPLALEVVGSSLFCRCLGTCECKGIWKDTLDELRRVPDKNVEDTLMISIKRLDEKQKSVFLDIACFLISKDKTNAVFMWRDCELSPNKVINSLILISLVKINDDKFWMHDQLRDLGRAIVHRENRNPGRRSRVWNVQEAKGIIEKKQGTDIIEVLFLDSFDCKLTDEESAKLENLRFLKLRGKLEGDFKNLLPNLRWLCWENDFSCSTIFCLRNLVVLELWQSLLSEDWKGWEQLKMANKLKVLDLTLCSNLRATPDFSSFVLLERLIIKHCDNLQKIDPSIGKLRKLTYLSMEGCRHLWVLPESIGELTNLNQLSFKGCRDVTLPESIGNLTSLVELDISYTEEITELPDSIGNLESLKVIYMDRSRIRRLPASFGLLKSLEELHASECYYLKGEIPRSINNLSHLKELHLRMDRSEDSKMECLPEFPSSLNTLAIIASRMKVTPDLSYLSKLTELTLHIHGIQCTELHWIRKLSQIKNLSIENSYATVRGDEFAPLIHLVHLHLSCPNLEWPLRLPSSLITLSIKKWLQTLSNDGLSLSVAIPCLAEVQMLRTLSLESCKFRDLDGLHLLSNLRSLDIRELFSCRRFPDLSSSGNITQSLQSIYVYRCNSLEALYGLSNLTNLRSLTILDCEGLRVVEGLEKLRACLGSKCFINPDHMLKSADSSTMGCLETMQMALVPSENSVEGDDEREDEEEWETAQEEEEEEWETAQEEEEEE